MKKITRQFDTALDYKLSVGVPSQNIAESFYGKGINSLFTGDSPVGRNPFQTPLRLKTDAPIDQDIIAKGIQNPQFNDFDPRTLRSSQPHVLKEGVQHYMNNPQQLFSDQRQTGNQHPVVYTKPTGENVLLTGTHRASAALLQGQPLRAIHIKAPQ